MNDDIKALQKLIGSVSYKPGLTITLLQNGPVFTVNFDMKVQCANERNGKVISIQVSKTEPIEAVNHIITCFPRWLRTQLLELEIHELDEWLLIDNVRHFDPHKDFNLNPFLP